MVSFISALTLFVLVLSNGCFTLPVVDEGISSSTYSSINDDVTTGETVNLRLVADEHMGYEVSNSSVDLSGNTFVKSLRSLDDLPNTADESANAVDRKSIQDQFENNTQIMHVETTTLNDTLSFTSTTIVPEHTTSELFTSSPSSLLFTSTPVVPEFTTSELFTSSSPSSLFTSTHVVPEFTTSELFTSSSPSSLFTSTSVVPELTTSELSTSTSSPVTVTTKTFTSLPRTKARKTSTSSPTTTTTSSSTSTEKHDGVLADDNKHDEEYEQTTKPVKVHRKSGILATKTSTSLPTTKITTTSTSTSTEKYVGLLEDDNRHDEEYEQTTKRMKIHRKSGVSSTKKPKVNVEYKPKEDPTESTIPTAVFDQQALDKVPNVPNDFLILDENNDLVVTGLPNETFTAITKANKKEEDAKPLNQGEKSSHS